LHHYSSQTDQITAVTLSDIYGRGTEPFDSTLTLLCLTGRVNSVFEKSSQLALVNMTDINGDNNSEKVVAVV
jgi:hypothetical protein